MLLKTSSIQILLYIKYICVWKLVIVLYQTCVYIRIICVQVHGGNIGDSGILMMSTTTFYHYLSHADPLSQTTGLLFWVFTNESWKNWNKEDFFDKNIYIQAFHGSWLLFVKANNMHLLHRSVLSPVFTAGMMYHNTCILISIHYASGYSVQKCLIRNPQYSS